MSFSIVGRGLRPAPESPAPTVSSALVPRPVERHRSRKLDRLVADQTVYHRIHIDQLHEFYRLTGAAIPETYAVRWQGYLAHPPRGV